MSNILLESDSYKHCFWNQYIPNTQTVYSYLECRDGAAFPEVCFFGLQYYLKRYLQGKVVTKEKIDEADELLAKHFNNPAIFNRSGWEYLLEKYDGHLPVSIKAVEEGTCVPISNVLLTIENTDSQCYWLTSYLQSLLLQVWYASTVATQSREIKILLLEYLESTGDPLLVDLQMNDFGFRGSSSVESAGIGSCAHLISFKGSETLQGLVVARDYYDCPLAGYAVPGSEHSTMISWGRAKEKEAFKNMLEQFPTGFLAVVSDSYDINAAIMGSWHSLREQVFKREGILLIRPDSGKLPDTLLQVLGWTGQVFGVSKNDKGYMLLHPKVRIMQGDGIDLPTLRTTLKAMKAARWSADNVIFGSGGGLLQKLNRDTMRFVFNCSSVTINGVTSDTFKQPVGDPKKHSKRGRMKLVKGTDTKQRDILTTVGEKDPRQDYLVEVFRNGQILRTTTLDEVRERAFVL